MIAEAIRLLAELGQKSEAAQTLDLPGNTLGVWVGGELLQFPLDRARRTPKVGTVASFINWCQEIGADRDVEILVYSHSVVARIDQETRHECDSCGLDLEYSPGLVALTQWAEKPLPIKAAVKLLRSRLAGTFEESHLRTLRRVDFKRENSSARALSHTGESLGRSVQAEANSAAGEIPEVLKFHVPVFNQTTGIYPFWFAVDIDCDNELIGIAAIGDCVEQAITLAKTELAAELKEALGNALVLVGP